VTYTRTHTTCRFYLDCEFIEDGSTIQLVSLGVVSSDGRTFYREVDAAEVNWDRANDWVIANVQPHLSGNHEVVRTRRQIAKELHEFVSEPNVRPEFWSWCAAYDWVVICQLYGPMVAKPADWPWYCRDLQQELDRLGVKDRELPEQDGAAHNALADAWWHHDIHRWLLDNADA
jgi:hypothetical protein